VASFGEHLDYLKDIQISVEAGDQFSQGPTGTAIREDRPYWCQDYQHSPATAPWRERSSGIEWRASASLPLHRNGAVIGALSLYAHRVNAFDEDARNLLTEMAADISHALDTFEAEAKRKQAEADLRESQELFSLYLRHSPIYTFIKDVTPTESRVLYASDGFLQMIGIPGEEMIGKTMEELFPAEFAAKITADDWAVVSSGEVLKLDEDLNGRNYTSIKFPVVQGGKTLLAGYTIDITERKQVEVELRRSKQQYDNLVSKIPVGIYILHSTPQGTFALDYASPRMAEILNLSVESLLANADLVSESIHPDDRDGFVSLNLEGIRNLRPFDWKGRVLADGKVKWLHISSSPEPQQNGDVLWNGLVVDITERKRADEALRASLREKESLLKEIHHRVKNNLQVITSLLRLEAGRSDQPHTKTVLKDMQNRIRSMALLHESLYRSENLERVDLPVYIKQLTTHLYRSMATDPGKIQLHLDLEPVSLALDQAVPCGLLVNELVSNCLKHGFPDGRRGEVHIDLQLLQPVEEVPKIRLRVSDNGVGLPMDFEEKRAISLGLQLISDLAKQLGGQLEIGGGPGTGAIFEVVFASMGLADTDS
jgi:PAS domain S-box-containing protein